MKKFLIVLYVLFLCVDAAFADSFMGDEFGGTIGIGTDSVVGENVLFQPGLVNVNDTIDFVNNGRVHSTFSICSMCDFVVRNRGKFDADFILGDDASVIQVVSDTVDWNPIESNVKYTLFIDGFSGTVLGEPFDIESLNGIILKDSVLNLSDVLVMDGADIDLRGDIVLVVDDFEYVYDMPVIRNVSGDGIVRILDKVADPLYAIVADIDNGELFVRRVRETDYQKIFANDMGLFLNDLRSQNSDDGLLHALDVATDMDALHRVMARSVRMNPELLLRPVRVLGEFNKCMGGIRTGVGVNLDTVFSDDFYSYGMGAGFGGSFEKLEFRIGLHFGDMEYESDLDSFSGLYYGLSLGADYLMENNLFVRGVANVMRFDFELGNVFYGDAIINNPSAVYGGGVADFGYRHEFSDSFYVAPFVGLDTVGTIVADMSDVDIRGRVGVELGYTYQMLGISYDYGVGVNANSDNEIMLNMRAGFLADYDGAGANINFALGRMFDVSSYKISIGGKAWF